MFTYICSLKRSGRENVELSKILLWYLNLRCFIVHPQPVEVDHEVDLKGLLQADAAGRPQYVGQVDALAVALVSAWHVFDSMIDNLKVKRDL